MAERNRTNVLLVEILLAVLFFMLSATVLVRVFATARSQSIRAGIETRALAEAQNVAEILTSGGDADEALKALDFSFGHGAYTKDYGDFTLFAQGDSEAYGPGTLWRGEVSAYYQVDELLFSLPCERYWGAAR